MKSFTLKERCLIGLTLFSMFFGAGNLIFPPFLGALAGDATLPAMSGFAVTAVLFPILGVAAVARSGGLTALGNRVHPAFAFLFTLLIYLSIGPCLAIPRTAGTSFEMAIAPLFAGEGALSGTILGFEAHAVAQAAYSVFFFLLAFTIALNPEKLTQRLGKILSPTLLTLIAVLFIAATQMRPLLESMATTRVSNTVTRIVSEAVYEAIEKGELQYDGLVSFEKDTEGHITAVQSNMAAFNHLQAEILDTVLTRISQVPTGDLSIPIGSLTGSTLLAGRGPRITVRMESVGSSEANFRNAFTSAGINQTKHQIILTVDVSVSVLLPGFRTATKVSNSFIVAETVIVGTVPDTYTYFSTDPDTYEEDLKDYILNNS